MSNKSFVVIIFCLILSVSGNAQKEFEAKLFSNLPEYCNNPDAMAFSEVENAIILSVPNLNDSLYADTFKYGLGKLLRFSDRNAMAHSREVRLPYLSHELVEFAFSLPSEYKMQKGWSKLILRESMQNVALMCTD